MYTVDSAVEIEEWEGMIIIIESWEIYYRPTPRSVFGS